MAKSAARSPADKDPALPQTRRARRRLIGAAALAIAAAIILTLVLDSEPRGTIREVEVSIPSRNNATADASRAAPAPQAPAAARTDVAGAIEGRVAGPMVPPPDEPPSEADRASPVASPAVAAADATATAHADASTRQATDQAAAKAAEQVQGQEKQATAPATSGSPAKRRPLGTDVALAPSAAEPAPGPKAAAPGEARPPVTAKAAAGNAGKQGRESKAPVASAKGSAATPTRRFSVQVGAFSTDQTAQAQAQRVRDAGLPVYTEKVITSQGARIRVRAGPFGSHEEAERASAKLKLSGVESAIIKP